MNSQEEIVKEQISLIPSAHSRQVTGSVNQINSMYVSKHLLCTQKSTWAKVTERDESKPGDCYTLPGIGTGLRWSSYLFPNTSPKTPPPSSPSFLANACPHFNHTSHITLRGTMSVCSWRLNALYYHPHFLHDVTE